MDRKNGEAGLWSLPLPMSRLEIITSLYLRFLFGFVGRGTVKWCSIVDNLHPQ